MAHTAQIVDLARYRAWRRLKPANDPGCAGPSAAGVLRS